jgi:hypothetical protein
VRVLALILLLTGCAYNVPISQFDPGIDELCSGGVHQWRGQLVEVVLSEDIYADCGPDARACSVGDTMWVQPGPKCPRSVAHELNHKFGNHWVDGYVE